ncbi:hypothetical protein BGX26_007749 [Mortierella sp. AD094]|nr:hypothetical protein BGX26_007749 [Mortierella sp. AD094]
MSPIFALNLDKLLHAVTLSSSKAPLTNTFYYTQTSNTVMSFLYSYFQDTPSEKENANTLRTKFTGACRDALKAECKQYESDYEQKLRQAEVDFRRTKLELKEQKDRQQMDAVLRVMNNLAQSNEYKGSSDNTRSKLEKIRSWIDYAASKADQHWTKERQQFDAKYGDIKTAVGAPIAEEKKSST